jgi:hypothetical protein
MKIYFGGENSHLVIADHYLKVAAAAYPDLDPTTSKDRVDVYADPEPYWHTWQPLVLARVVEIFGCPEAKALAFLHSHLYTYCQVGPWSARQDWEMNVELCVAEEMLNFTKQQLSDGSIPKGVIWRRKGSGDLEFRLPDPPHLLIALNNLDPTIATQMNAKEVIRPCVHYLAAEEMPQLLHKVATPLGSGCTQHRRWRMSEWALGKQEE